MFHPHPVSFDIAWFLFIKLRVIASAASSFLFQRSTGAPTEILADERSKVVTRPVTSGPPSFRRFSRQLRGLANLSTATVPCPVAAVAEVRTVDAGWLQHFSEWLQGRHFC